MAQYSRGEVHAKASAGESFRSADLSGLDLHDANLKRANLSGAILIGTNLEGADLSRADPRQAEMLNARLERSNLFDIQLSEANMLGASLVSSNLRRVNLIGNTVLIGADLREAHLSHAFLNGENIWGARFENAYLNDVEYDEETKWPKMLFGRFNPEKDGAVLE